MARHGRVSEPIARHARALAIIAAGLLSAGGCAPETPYDGRFALVVESDESFSEVGAATPRELYARLLEAMPADDTSAVALRFFLFDARDAEVDGRLAAAIAAHRTYTQYALRGEGPAAVTAATPAIGVLAGAAVPEGTELLRAERSELPAPIFLNAMTGMGFVDVVEPFEADLVPLIGLAADGAVVKSLALLLLEAVHGPAELIEGQGLKLRIGGGTLELDARGRAACDIMALAIDPVDIVAVVESRASDALRGRMPIVSYGGVEAPRFRTGLFASLDSHELFFRGLACLDARIDPRHAVQNDTGSGR